jgi:uncharacterized OB-fold protein
MSGIDVCVCAACGHAVFPYRALCPACGARSWRRERVHGGVIEERTAIRHRIGVTRRVSVPVASVGTDAGPVVVARLLGDAFAGDRVELLERGGVAAARPVPNEQRARQAVE